MFLNNSRVIKFLSVVYMTTGSRDAAHLSLAELGWCSSKEGFNSNYLKLGLVHSQSFELK